MSTNDEKLITLGNLRTFKNKIEEEINKGGDGGSGTGSGYDKDKGEYLEKTLGIPMNIDDVVDIHVTTIEHSNFDGSKYYEADGINGSIAQSSNVIALDKVRYFDDGTDTTITFWRQLRISVDKVEFLNNGAVISTITSNEFSSVVEFDISNAAYKEEMIIKGKTLADLTTDSNLKLEVKTYDMQLQPILKNVGDIEDGLAQASNAIGLPQNIPSKITVDVVGVAQPADAGGIIKYVAYNSSDATASGSITQSSNVLDIDRVIYWEGADKKTYIEKWRPLEIQLHGTIKVGDKTPTEIENPENFDNFVSYDPGRGAYKESLTVDAELDTLCNDKTKLHIEINGIGLATITKAVKKLEDGSASLLGRRFISLYGMGTQAQADELVASNTDDTKDFGQEGDLFFVLDDATS